MTSLLGGFKRKKWLERNKFLLNRNSFCSRKCLLIDWLIDYRWLIRFLKIRASSVHLFYTRYSHKTMHPWMIFLMWLWLENLGKRNLFKPNKTKISGIVQSLFRLIDWLALTNSFGVCPKLVVSQWLFECSCTWLLILIKSDVYVGKKGGFFQWIKQKSWQKRLEV